MSKAWLKRLSLTDYRFLGLTRDVCIALLEIVPSQFDSLLGETVHVPRYRLAAQEQG